MKIAVGLILVLVLGSSVAWLVNLVKMKEQLLVDLAVEQNANQINVQALKKSQLDQEILEKQVLDRKKSETIQKIQLINLRKRLNEQSKNFTDAENKCLTSDIPAPIINFLQGHSTGSTTN